MPPLVYVVDDEPVIAETVAAILNVSGFLAVPFIDPTMALEAALREAPELLISDVMMAEMNGVELAVQVRMLHPDCRVLLFSGYEAAANLLKEATGNGEGLEILAKPIHPKDLLEKIRGL